ncbi:uncharacterized protein LOC130498625 isoform X5 [Raphanus sativus]|uniref:Uncharacterized protein LOC130498625 isoform X5 n=1 Tax=Raphanus sativus TaxID=3726 RepID=A0A9W3C955_RAPSA|nr:uncharacterized protein LOC130498625 isoform X5 [Raphanus sativus]
MRNREKVSSSFSVSQTSFFRGGWGLARQVLFLGEDENLAPFVVSVSFHLSLHFFIISIRRAGFVSLDCGGTEPFTDEHGLNWTPDDHLLYGSMYLTGVEDKFHLSVAARINFGAETEDPVRYPDDPYDRIWESDLLKKANCVSKNPQIRGCWDCTICSVFVNHEQMPTTYITCPVSIYNKMV